MRLLGAPSAEAGSSAPFFFSMIVYFIESLVFFGIFSELLDVHKLGANVYFEPCLGGLHQDGMNRRFSFTTQLQIDKRAPSATSHPPFHFPVLRFAP